jgi:hypothetical protein
MGAGFRAVGVTGLPAFLGQTGPQVEILETSIGTRGFTAGRRGIVRVAAHRPGQAARRSGPDQAGGNPGTEESGCLKGGRSPLASSLR